MPHVEKTTRTRTRMEMWLFNHYVVYRKLAQAAGIDDYRRVWAIAKGFTPTEAERTSIIKGLHTLGFKCLPEDLW